mmetsp:Transcript_102089/g.259437  ORF Transcript_102089/g.259437 Transcript_102089/m.259437 type:complete len:233 (-) Transcript_102089:3-701(-)
MWAAEGKDECKRRWTSGYFICGLTECLHHFSRTGHGAEPAKGIPRTNRPMGSDRLDAEMQTDKAEDEALQVLHQVVEDPETLGVLGGLHVRQGANLGGREGDVLLAADHLQLLAPDPVRSWPVVVVLLEDLAVLDGLPELPHHRLRDVRLLADHNLALIVRVVGVAEAAVRAELKLEELMAELALVADVVPHVKLLLLLRSGHLLRLEPRGAAAPRRGTMPVGGQALEPRVS